MGFIKVLLIFAILYYGFKWFAKYITPFLLKKFINKYGMHQQQWNDHASPKEKEGEVKIKTKPETKKKKFDGGEYVNFEEVDDNKN